MAAVRLLMALSVTQLVGCVQQIFDPFPDSVAAKTDGVINPSDRLLPVTPFICDAPGGESRVWLAKLNGPFSLAVTLRFLEPRRQAESLWPGAQILGMTEEGTITGGVGLANFFFVYLAVGIGDEPEAQDEPPARRPLGVYGLGEEVTFLVVWEGNDSLRVRAEPQQDEKAVERWVELSMSDIPMAMAVSCQSSRVEFLELTLET